MTYLNTYRMEMLTYFRNKKLSIISMDDSSGTLEFISQCVYVKDTSNTINKESIITVKII
jgi:hypothetical protein